MIIPESPPSSHTLLEAEQPEPPLPAKAPVRRWAWFSLHSSHVVAVCLLGVVFLYYDTLQPFTHNEIWSHVRYGEWIVNEGALPTQELFSRFADPEYTYTNFYWLSQVIFYLVYHTGELLHGGSDVQQMAAGVQMLRTFFALLMVLKVGLVMLALWRSARSLPLAIVGGLLVFVWMLPLNRGIKPQAFGEVFFAFLLWWMSAPRLSRWSVLILPQLFIVWVNCHPSFIAGLGFLTLFWLGRMIEFAWRCPELC